MRAESSEMQSNIPVLETERLRLRGHTVADQVAACAMWSNPDVTRFIGGKPSSAQQTWQRILSYAGHWALLEFGYWVVEERVSGRYAGEIGFADYKRAIEPSIAGIPELGWAFDPAFQGKGYADEALRAALKWGDAHLGPRSVCLISPDNARSIRLAANIGFTEFAQTSYNDSPALLFERLRATS